MIKSRTFVCGLLLASAWPLGAGERLTMQVSPSVSLAPANLRVRAMVAADPDNRAIEIAADGPNFYRSSRIQLDGDEAPRTLVLEFRSLPSGTYEVTAVLIGATGERARTHQEVVVKGHAED